MIKCDLHTHTVFCDGKNTPEEMVLSAIEKGLDTIGICAHCYTAFTDAYCISLDGEKEFKKTVNQLKIKYADKIKVLLGIEQDVLATYPASGYDYIIGSSHFFEVDGKNIDVDHTEEKFINAVNTYFNGDYYSAAEHYYENVKRIIKVTGADIIAHVDLITKFNEGDKLFSTSHPRYINAFKSAIDELIKAKKPFEINTGAISRGYRSEPYPQKQICDYIKSLGGKLILSSDSHSAKNIAFEFDKWQKLL